MQRPIGLVSIIGAILLGFSAIPAFRQFFLDSPTANVHIIIGVAPIFSHFEKFKVIAQALIRQGYNVTFLTGPLFREEIEEIGATFSQLNGSADFDFENRHTTYPELRVLPEGPERVLWEMRKWFIDPIPDQHRSLQRILGEIKSTAPGKAAKVIYLENNSFGAASPVFYGAPNTIWPDGIIKIGTCTLTMESVDTPPWGRGLAPYSSAQDRTARRERDFDQFNAMMGPIQKSWEAALGAAGVPLHGDQTARPARFLDGLARSCDIYLQMSIPELEYVRSDLPEWVRFIGALPAVGRRNNTPSLPDWWDDVIYASDHQKKPIVVVSQGSVHNDPRHLIIPTIQSLQDLDVTVIATLVETAELPSDVSIPSNTRIAQFIPFDLLFPHATALVSNGGFGTVQQALFHGLPMVLAGTSADKAETNAHVAWAGAAINLAQQQPKAKTIRDAVIQVLSNSTWTDQSLKLRGRYASYDAVAEIVKAIEELARDTDNKRRKPTM
ncbi:hypothetical protein NLG97_g797 [Lecanicillium saksenae]|uniref:Uncharacterized protein n=1 Tax=Lecanicillium saksenae TaxID=468837 RepID=A0ACC1R876_9HYPO|nr:hypothetical protein NLG97_g797 [Lecanicillium saksenae]